MLRPLRHTCSAQGVVRESRWSRVTSLGLRAMPSVVVALCFSTSVCAFAESADAQPRALAAAAAAARSDDLRGLSGSRLSCSTAMRPLSSSEPAVLSRFRTISHTIVRPPRVRKNAG